MKNPHCPNWEHTAAHTAAICECGCHFNTLGERVEF